MEEMVSESAGYVECVQRIRLACALVALNAGLTRQGREERVAFALTCDRVPS